MRSDQIHSLRQTHHSIASLARLATATLTIAGVVLAAMERSGERQATREAGQPYGQQPGYQFGPQAGYQYGQQPGQPYGQQPFGPQYGQQYGQPTQPRRPGAQQSQPAQFAYPYAIAPQVTRVVPVVNPVAAPQVIYRPRRLTIFGYLGALFGRVLAVVIGMVAVAGLVALYFAADSTWRAIELTTLVLLILYLTERVARARRRA